jgi:hypothetical protein
MHRADELHVSVAELRARVPEVHALVPKRTRVSQFYTLMNTARRYMTQAIANISSV